VPSRGSSQATSLLSLRGGWTRAAVVHQKSIRAGLAPGLYATAMNIHRGRQAGRALCRRMLASLVAIQQEKRLRIVPDGQIRLPAHRMQPISATTWEARCDVPSKPECEALARRAFILLKASLLVVCAHGFFVTP
jgi:hypothetical protein